MLKLQDIKLESHYAHGYARGAKSGYRCTVTLQTGEYAHDRVIVTLPPETVRAMIVTAAEEAMKRFTLDLDAIDVEGAPGVPEPEAQPAHDQMAEAA